MNRFPDKPALDFSLNNRDISYRELDEMMIFMTPEAIPCGRSV